MLRIGSTSAPVHNPDLSIKVPDVLFYENPQVRTGSPRGGSGSGWGGSEIHTDTRGRGNVEVKDARYLPSTHLETPTGVRCDTCLH